MSILSADKAVNRKEGGLQSFPVKDNDILYKGGLVTIDASGYAEPAANTAGRKFAGVAYEKVDNTLTGHSAGGKDIRVYTEGVFKLVCTDITQAMVGQMMYIKDDQTVDNTSTNFVAVGILVGYVNANLGWVDIGQRGLTKDAITGEQIADDSVAKEHLDSAIKYIQLQRKTSVLKQLTGQNDVGWTDLDLDTVTTVPSGAIGLIVEGYAYAGAATPTFLLRKKGEEVNDWQWARLSAQVAGLAINNMMIVEMDADHIIQYRLQSTGNNGTGACYMKLLGWIIQP